MSGFQAKIGRHTEREETTHSEETKQSSIQDSGTGETPNDRAMNFKKLLVSHKANLRTRKIIWEKGRHYILVNLLILQEDP